MRFMSKWKETVLLVFVVIVVVVPVFLSPLLPILDVAIQTLMGNFKPVFFLAVTVLIPLGIYQLTRK